MQVCRRNIRNGGLELNCSPNSVAARVLQSDAPNDIHPAWGGRSNIGLGWRFEVLGAAKRDGVVYLNGDIIGPRGGVINRDVMIIAHEWACR